MSIWKCRVTLKDGRYAVHKIFYDEEGEPRTCTEDPVCPEGEILEALREELEHYQLALEWPVLEYADLAPYYEPSELDTEEPLLAVRHVCSSLQLPMTGWLLQPKAGQDTFPPEMGSHRGRP